jgi:hypothetical protein
MSNLSVLSPTGAIFPVKLPPTATAKAVLDAACAKFSLEPGAHCLKYKDKPVDLTQPLRFLSFPANTRLMMAATDPRAAVAAPVQLRVGLQLAVCVTRVVVVVFGCIC